MKVQQSESRLSSRLTAFCLVVGVVGSTSFLMHGPSGFAWGLGWALSASAGSALLHSTRWGVVQGISAGLYAGVGLGNLTLAAGLLQGILIRGLFWGLLGGIVGTFALRSVRRTGFRGSLAIHFCAAFASGMVGMVVVGLIGEILQGFSLSGAGFLIGVVLMTPVWAVCSTAGLIIGHLVFRSREQNPT